MTEDTQPNQRWNEFWVHFATWIGSEQNNSRNRIFRGVKCSNYCLIPKIGREEWRPPQKDPGTGGERVSGYLPNHEARLYDLFRDRARAHLTSNDIVPSNGVDWMALAQHHGLPTRMLDWSFSPLVAAFFAVEDLRSNHDAAIYALRLKEFLDPREIESIEPMNLSDVFFHIPPPFSKRISAQQAVLSMHPNPTIPWNPPAKLDQEKFAIPAEFKEKIKYALFNLGIHHESMFPDLDGLAQKLAWQYETESDDNFEYPLGNGLIATRGGVV